MLVQLMKSREQNLYLQKKYNVTAYFYDILDYPWERIYRKWRPKLVALEIQRIKIAIGGRGENPCLSNQWAANITVAGVFERPAVGLTCLWI